MGRTYFRLTFADRDLTMPGVEPLIFLGEVMEEGGSNGFVFQDTSSFVQYGSGLEGDEQHEDIAMYARPENTTMARMPPTISTPISFSFMA